MANKTIIGENIKKYRKQAKMTQAQLAEKVGVAPGTIQQYELGKRTPGHTTLEKIAEKLKIDVVSLKVSEEEIKAILDAEIAETKLFLQRENGRERIYLLECFSKLNRTGKNKALDYIEDLLEQPKYQEDANSSAQNDDTLILGYPNK
ncbi:MAG: XRE family transcriptional regulator [Clostridia bacterium]|nr:XRE family transcriptional regulator [Clostridia bacterium]